MTRRREITPTAEALKTAAQIILDTNIRGARKVALDDLRRRMDATEEGECFYDYLQITYERAWAVGCDLSIRMERDGGLEVDGDGTRIDARRATVSINWSGTGRSVQQATASIALYTEVTAMAAEIQAKLDETRYGNTYPAVEAS